MPKRKYFSRTVLARGSFLLVWMAVIFAFSALPGSPYWPGEPPLWYLLERKGAHVIEYAFLMFLSVRFFYALFPKERFRDILFLAAIFSLTYAVTDELHQFFVPNRGAKATDVLIDGAGIALTAFLFWTAKLLRKPAKPGRRKQP